MKKVLSIPIATLMLGWLQINKAFAQDDVFGVNGMTDTVLGTRGIEDTIASIINIILGLLGLIAVVLIIYGGFLWMTSKGNTDQVQRAKMVIISAVIGLVIITAAYAITRFVINSLGDATGATNSGVVVVPPGPGGSLCPPPLIAGDVETCDVYPASGTVASAFTVGAWNIGGFVDPATSFIEFDDLAGNSSIAEIASCGVAGPMWNLVYAHPNLIDNYYEVVAIVPALPVSLPNYDVEVHNAALPAAGVPTPNQYSILAGPPAPSIFCIQPSNVPTSTAVSIIGRNFGPGGQILDEVFVNGWPGGVHNPQFPLPNPGNITSWADDQIDFTVHDDQISGNVTVQVDDGGGVNSDTSNPFYFTVSCDNDGECASGCCPGAPGGYCAEEVICTGVSSAPHITAISPDNGTDGNIVTIFGYNFCDNVACAPGTVWFTEDLTGNPIPGIAPNAINLQCANYWTDNAIIIGVPNNVANPTGQVTMETAAAVASDNAMTFTENGSVYPGICALQDAAGNPLTTGFFDDGIPVHVHGINFANNDIVTFGSFLGYNTVYPGLPTEVQSDVPNIVGIADVEVENAAGFKSNPFPFTALAVTGGLPIISEISPTSTRIGQYTTVMGANFGNTPGDVEFWQFGVHISDGQYTFPPQCSSGYWRHDSIIVKPPTDLITSGGVYGDFDVIVLRSGDGATSLPHSVEVLAGPPGPGICLMQPDNGPAGQTIDFYGDNFGAGPGLPGGVIFYDGQFANLGTATWNNQSVLNVPVPNAAATGPVLIRDASAADSNSMVFSVGSCSTDTECQSNLMGNICCPDVNGNFCDNYLGCSTINECTYGWRFTTESLLTVLNQGPNCDNSCVNAEVWVDFNTEIDNADLDPAHFTLRECQTPACAAFNGPPNMIDGASVFTQTNPVAGVWHVEVTHPTFPFNNNTYYLAEVDGSTRNTDGAILGNIHSWIFATSDQNCDVDHIDVTPAAWGAYIGDNITYAGQAWSAPGTCDPAGQPIVCNAVIGCNWNAWNNDNTFTTLIPLAQPDMVDASADAVTPAGGTQIGASATQGATTFTDFGVLDITVGPTGLNPLNRLNNGPVCSDSCTNGIVWVDFNSEVTVNYNTANFTIFECATPACLATVGPNLNTGLTPIADLGGYWQAVLNHANFNPNTHYQVTIDGAIANADGSTLTGGTYFWNFGVGDYACDVGSIDVLPASIPANVGNVVGFVGQAYSLPGICYPAGQPIICDGAIGCAWSPWTLNPAFVSQVALPQPNNISVSADAVTPPGGTQVAAEAIQGANTFNDFGILDISLGGAGGVFFTLGYGPTCSDSCTNGLVWADFNLEPVLNTIPTIYTCDNPGCTSTSGPSLLIGGMPVPFELFPGGPWQVNLLHNPFIPNTNYQAFIGGDTTDLAGNELGAPLYWSFGTGIDNCVVDHIDINPPGPGPLLTTLNMGDSASYSVQTYSTPGICYPGGQPITCDAVIGCTLQWNLDSLPNNLVTRTTPMVAVGATYDAVAVGNNDEVMIRALQPPLPPFFDSTFVNVTTGVSPGSPNLVGHEPMTPFVCTNGAPTAIFDQLMNAASVNNNIKVYRIGVPGPGCVSPGNPTLCEVSGHLTTINDVAIPEARAMFNADEHFATTTQYMFYVDPAVESLDGLPLGIVLDPSFSWVDITGDAVVDGQGWVFTTTATACQLSHAVIMPSNDFFYCAHDDCDDGDVQVGGNNEHNYTAIAYGIDGTPLNVSNYSWTIDQPALFSVNSTVAQQIRGWPGFTNGHVTLSVQAWDVNPNINGIVGATAGIDIFLCENPWPSAADVPWEPDPPPNRYNYATYYCLDDSDGGTLPVLDSSVSATNPNPDGVLVSGERIFIINPPTSMGELNLAQYQFGSLAYGREVKDNEQVADKSWFDKIKSAIWGDTKEASGQMCLCAPGIPTNLQVTSVDSTQVSLSWAHAAQGFGVPPLADITQYRIYRREVPGPAFGGVYDTVNGATITYTDNAVTADTTYQYAVTAMAGNCCGGTESPIVTTVTVTASDLAPHVDIIGIRVMGNDEHLSLKDWYSKYAPNPDAPGELKEIDGYEAMQAGNTTYVSALNFNGLLYSNIYIVSHNIGASGATREIYRQLVDNMTFNANMPRMENVCNANTDTICSSDFDCPIGDYCESRDLKIKRDLRRLGDLMNVKTMIEEYGQAHKACSHNSAIACEDDTPCALGGGVCIPYYPMLNAGTFVNGMSNSNWPSWGGVFAETLGNELPADPISLFNGCPPDADPDTCWDELVSPPEFTCPADSLIYFYQTLNNLAAGDDYFLGANFEYDSNPALHFAGITFGCDLYNGPANPRGIWPDPACFPATIGGMPHVYSTLDSMCSVGSVYSPGAVTIPSCGNGTWEPDGEDGIPATPDDEECEPGMMRDMCSATVAPLGQDWWNASSHMGGCNPVGAEDTFGNLIECTWYVPDPALTAADCGGYCGNWNVDSPYESCDSVGFDGLYTCYDPVTMTTSTPLCNNTVCEAYCPAGNLAALCGDGIWDSDHEMCDASADPNGLLGWDCGIIGATSTISCNNNCYIECDSGGILYNGVCGNDIIEWPEECEPALHTVPMGSNATSGNQYLCDPTYCVYDGGYCDDGFNPGAYDLGGGTGELIQLIDGSWFSQPEECDPMEWDTPAPFQSSEDFEYICNPECIIDGGYCTDGIVQTYGAPANEECDDGDQSDANVCTNNCEWGCFDLFPFMEGNLGGIVSSKDVGDGLLFDNLTSSVELHAGDSSTLDLGTCRISGDVIVDVTRHGDESYAGIVFVTDRSGSMPNGMPTIKTALHDAVNEIFSRNPTAQIALVSYNSAPTTDRNFTGFSNANLLHNAINAYTDSGMTDHSGGLARARNLFLASSFEHNIVIFMTDGDPSDAAYGCNNGGSIGTDADFGVPLCISENDLKFCNAPGDLCAQVFTVYFDTGGAVDTNQMQGFLNAVASSDCAYNVGSSGRNALAGTCGTNGIECRNSANQFEECDEVSPDCTASCQWTGDRLTDNRAYVGNNAAELLLLYQNISGSIPMNNISLEFDNAGSTSTPTGILLDGEYHIETYEYIAPGPPTPLVTCNDPLAVNTLEIDAYFQGNPAAYIELSDPVYEFCHWYNCPWCFN